jgi:hypothetical protein
MDEIDDAKIDDAIRNIHIQVELLMMSSFNKIFIDNSIKILNEIYNLLKNLIQDNEDHLELLWQEFGSYCKLLIPKLQESFNSYNKLLEPYSQRRDQTRLEELIDTFEYFYQKGSVLVRIFDGIKNLSIKKEGILNSFYEYSEWAISELIELRDKIKRSISPFVPPTQHYMPEPRTRYQTPPPTPEGAPTRTRKIYFEYVICVFEKEKDYRYVESRNIFPRRNFEIKYHDIIEPNKPQQILIPKTEVNGEVLALGVRRVGTDYWKWVRWQSALKGGSSPTQSEIPSSDIRVEEGIKRLEDKLKNIQENLEQLKEDIKNQPPTNYEELFNKINELIYTINTQQKSILDVLEDLKNTQASLPDRIKNVIMEVPSKFAEELKKVLDGFKEELSKLPENISRSLDNLIKTFNETVKQIYKDLEEIKKEEKPSEEIKKEEEEIEEIKDEIKDEIEEISKELKGLPHATKEVEKGEIERQVIPLKQEETALVKRELDILSELSYQESTLIQQSMQILQNPNLFYDCVIEPVIKECYVSGMWNYNNWQRIQFLQNIYKFLNLSENEYQRLLSLRQLTGDKEIKDALVKFHGQLSKTKELFEKYISDKHLFFLKIQAMLEYFLRNIDKCIKQKPKQLRLSISNEQIREIDKEIALVKWIPAHNILELISEPKKLDDCIKYGVSSGWFTPQQISILKLLRRGMVLYLWSDPQLSKYLWSIGKEWFEKQLKKRSGAGQLLTGLIEEVTKTAEKAKIVDQVIRQKQIFSKPPKNIQPKGLSGYGNDWKNRLKTGTGVVRRGYQQGGR